MNSQPPITYCVLPTCTNKFKNAGTYLGRLFSNEGSGSKPRPCLQFSEVAPSCAEKLERAEDESRWDSGNELEPVDPRSWAPASPSKIGGQEDGLRAVAAKDGALRWRLRGSVKGGPGTGSEELRRRR